MAVTALQSGEDGFSPPSAQSRPVRFGLGCAYISLSNIYSPGWRRRFRLSIRTRHVLAAGFIDHEGRIGDFRLTDGSTRTSIFRRPHSFVLLEAFKIKGGRIAQVEASFLTVPYNMPSPWPMP